jgi:hypothetical protein
LQRYRETLKAQLIELQQQRNNAIGKKAKHDIGMEMQKIARSLAQYNEYIIRFRHMFYNIVRQELDDTTFRRLVTMTWNEIRKINLQMQKPSEPDLVSEPKVASEPNHVSEPSGMSEPRQ